MIWMNRHKISTKSTGLEEFLRRQSPLMPIICNGSINSPFCRELLTVRYRLCLRKAYECWVRLCFRHGLILFFAFLLVSGCRGNHRHGSFDEITIFWQDGRAAALVIPHAYV